MAWFFFVSAEEWQSVVDSLARIEQGVTGLATKLNAMEIEMTAMEDAVTALGTQVQANTNAEQSAITLIQNLATLIQQNSGDPTAINDLAARLKASADALAAAIVANTPSG